MTKVTEIQDAVASLPPKDRAKIATFILEGLEEAHYWVEDEEVLRRAAEFESGKCVFQFPYGLSAWDPLEENPSGGNFPRY